MTNDQFNTELWIRAYIDQVSGYPMGHPARRHFYPIVPTHRIGANGTLDRKGTLEFPCYHNFTDEEKKILLVED